ncbi:MAG: AAA family ATPase [Chloroflexi bacterium]|uniref:AAA family ATPase n=1 Tax=Candidatus Chlorohelix allophototropha TaxID=3003348 RepID=A0A8T7MAP5_9CHLR|nr:AAA family ATPase [Chloroflexota bacterium]WJW70420.1 AAA family ATPase [Chloroflexota bacterium L227-S17]
MILTVGNTKGGVGKTTLAVNIAIARALAGSDVLLVDGDEQGTSVAFTELRTEKLGEPGYTAVSLQGGAIRTQVRQLASKYDDIVIDVGGRDTGSIRAALLVTHKLLVPVQPRSFDLWAMYQVAELVKEARELNTDLAALALLNIADSQGRDNEEALEAVREIEGLQMLGVTIGRRKAFPNAAAAGRSVLEQSPKDAKAVEELQAVIRAIYN